MLLINFRSILNKLDTLNSFLYTCSADILIGTETWLSADISNSELNFPAQFTVFRKDRSISKGGGVIIAVKQEFQPSDIAYDSSIEAIWVTAQSAHTTVIIGACYRPPDSGPEFVDLLNDSLEYVHAHYPNSVLILGGDFNYPGIDWASSSVSSNSSHRHECLRFLHLTHVHLMTQLVTEPTRGDNILDLLFTNNSQEALTHVLEEISDHRVVHCSLYLPRADKSKVTKQLLNYACADIDKMNRMLDDFIPIFESSFEHRAANENWLQFRDTLKKIEECCVPKLTISTKTNDPWFTRDVKRCLNRKKRAFKRATRTNTPEDWLNYKNLSKQAEASIKEAKEKYFNCTLPNLLKTDPQKFWRVVNPTAYPSEPTLLSDQGKALSPEESAECFNEFFASVFTEELPLDSLALLKPTIHDPFSSITITENGVAQAVQRLPRKTSPGPDGISAKLLKLTCHRSAYLLSLIFQQSLDTGCVPEDWKYAFVKPIYKSGQKSSPNNYRPISLTCISCKLLEHIIYSKIISHLNRNNILIPNQHGFREKRSCNTQLFELLTDLHKSMHSSAPTDAIFIDLSKAFDRVQHNRLITKVRNLQLDQKTIQWIQEFLCNRSQSVKLNHIISRKCMVKSGVPQGSVLGPLLFLVYINDIGSNIVSSLRLFADDCVIYKEITEPNDSSILQSDLLKLAEWCNLWQMHINAEKTKHIRFTSVANPSSSVRYIVNSTVIETVSSTKYLGIFFSSDLTWNSHIEYITSKSSKKLGLLKRRLRCANLKTKLHAYQALIRPSLEYASTIWHPHTAMLSDMLESVQNKAARFITSCHSRHQSVTCLKRSLNLPLLATRRKLSRLCFFHSLYHSDSSFSRSFIHPAPYVSDRVGHAHKVNPIYSRTKKYQFSPLLLSINEWNALPSNIVAITEPSLFQSAVLTYLEVDNNL